MVGVAVRLTVEPVQRAVLSASSDTLTGSNGLTVRETVFEEAGFPEGQEMLEVSTT